MFQKVKIVSLAENWYLDLFEYAEFNGCVHFFCFIPETLFLVNEVKRSSYRLRDRTGVETLKLAAVVNTAFLFCCGECVRGSFLCPALKIFK